MFYTSKVALIVIFSFTLALYLNHVLYLSTGRFDYQYNMVINIVVGKYLTHFSRSREKFHNFRCDRSNLLVRLVLVESETLALRLEVRAVRDVVGALHPFGAGWQSSDTLRLRLPRHLALHYGPDHSIILQVGIGNWSAEDVCNVFVLVSWLTTAGIFKDARSIFCWRRIEAVGHAK